MCGIAGMVGHFENKVESIDAMLTSIMHRGPDDAARYFDGEFAGGMRRLSINDLAGGNQPLFNGDRTVAVLYNGEIYNSRLLRQELEAAGVRFRTQSDGEVIGHLYDRLGDAAFERLDGMFAVALWDGLRRRLLLARDIPGEKPLYYVDLGDGRCVFASEVKAIRQVKGLTLTLDRQSLWDFPTFLWIPEPNTAYKEVKALPRQHLLIVESGKVRIQSYENRFCPYPFDEGSEASMIKAVRKTVEDAVESRLLSDVPIGSFLSGGLDSTIVSTLAARKLPRLDTFTVAFEDVQDPYHGRADESQAAEHTARAIGSNHHVIPVGGRDFRRELDNFCRYGDLPFAVSSGLGILAVASAARQLGIKVLLTGDGADECFGGYSWYAHFETLNKLNSHASISARDPVSFQNIGVPLDTRLAVLAGLSARERAWAWHYYAHEDEKRRLFAKDWNEGLESSLRYFDGLKGNSGPREYVAHDRMFYFPNEMLRKVDRMAMAYSVEGRTPFAAPSVLRLADQIPFRAMVKGGTLKWILRKAFADILTPEVLERPKHGFNVPVDHWLKGEWADLLDEAFEPGSALNEHGLLARDARDAAGGMLSDTARLNGHTLFCFIMLNKWLGS